MVSKKWLGSWQAFPYLYMFFISPAGKARKTTTAGYAFELLDGVPHVKMGSDTTTVQSLIKDLSEAQEASVSVLAGEFSDFIASSGVDMINFLTSAFDGKPRHTYSTILRGKELADKPCINLLAAATPRYIAEEMPGAAIEGGFFSRIIPIYEEKVRRRQMFYEGLDYKAIDRLGQKLKADLIHLSSSVEGEFGFELDAKEYIEEWYRINADLSAIEDHRATGYNERKPAYAIKLAMLLHISYSDELVIGLNDFTDALKVLEQIEKKLPKALRAGSKNPYVSDMDHIKEFIERKGAVARSEILNRFAYAAPPMQLLELVAALVAMEEITADGSDPKSGIVYRPVKKKQVKTDLTKVKGAKNIEES